MIGTTTDADGRFSLTTVPAGAHRLYATMVGYAPYERDSLFHAGGPYTFEIQLERTTVMLEEITISAREARKWQRRLLKFERLFLGETPNSDSTTITNPEILSFTSRLGRLSASASAPLIIENRSLGYRLEYHLKEFTYAGNTIKYDGEPFFTELDPADSAQAKAWEAKRLEAFFGSERHFFLALLDNRTSEEGFVIYRRTRLERDAGIFRVDPEKLLREGPTPLEKELTFLGFLEIIYTREKEGRDFQRWQRSGDWRRPGDQRSFIELNDGPTLVDQAGEVIDPYGITVYGYFAFERMADRMPKEYRPPTWPHYSSER